MVKMEDIREVDYVLEKVSNAKADSKGLAWANLLIDLLVDSTSADKRVENLDDLLTKEHLTELRTANKLSPRALFSQFLQRSLAEFSEGNELLANLTKFCCRHIALWEEAFEICGRVITGHCIKLVSDNVLQVRVSQSSSGRLSRTSILQRMGSRLNGEIDIPDGYNLSTAITVLQTLLRFLPSHSVFVPQQLPVFLCFLVGAKDERLSKTANEALLLMLSESTLEFASFTDEKSDVSAADLADCLWTQVFGLVAYQQETRYINRGLGIWLRLVSLPSFNSQSNLFSPHLAEISTSMYWDALCSFLAHGTSEQRKFCLAILKVSVATLSLTSNHCYLFVHNIEDDADFQIHYRKFLSVYETVIIARYLNQVQDALVDLAWLASSASLVHPSWLILILRAGLGSDLQDSIRNMIGFWTIKAAADILSKAPNAVPFLELAFLPWAIQGFHFTTSVVKSSNNAISCTFGKNLAAFISCVIVKSENRENVCEGILCFLLSKKDSVFPYSKAFVLQGVLQGIRQGQVKYLSNAAAPLADLTSKQKSLNVVSDLLLLQTKEISNELGAHKDGRNEASDSIIKTTLQDLKEDCSNQVEVAARWFVDDVLQRELTNESSLESLTSWSQIELYPVKQLLGWIEYSDRACLKAEGLQKACHFLYTVLSEKRLVENDRALLHKVLELLWSVIKIRDYPRSVMRDFIEVAFHSRCIELLSSESGLTKTIGRISVSLLILARNKIYLFTPLAEAIRRAVLSIEQSQYLPLAEILETYVEEPPRAKIEFDLERVMSEKLEKLVPGKNYEYYYGEPEEFGHAYLFDMLNSMPLVDWWDDCYCRVLDSIIARWTKQKGAVPASSSSKSTAQLQVMLLTLQRLALSKNSMLQAVEYLEKLHNLLKLEVMPRFRFLLEWMITKLYLSFATRQEDVFQMLSGIKSTNDIGNPKYTASLIKIALRLACSQDSKPEYAFKLMTSLVVLSTSQKVAVRYEAQWSIPKLYSYASDRALETVTLHDVFRRLNDHIQNLEMYKIPPKNRQLEEFDPINDNNLIFLLQGKFLHIEPQKMPLATYRDFETLYEKDPIATQIQLLEVKSIKNGFMYEKYENQRLDVNMALSRGDNTTISATTTPLQMKSTVLQADREKKRRVNYEIIVVASLIDSSFNLGGISRTCEILGAKSLCVSNKDVINSKEFTSVSVASHKWLPISELKLTDIADFLREYKSNGYEIVGIEQTDSSKILGSENCRFSSRTVLLLGSEKEGIPANLLSEMDSCVEIKQHGVTRSMNVQNALAVTLYEYQRQNYAKDAV